VNRRALITLLGSAVAWPLAARAQQRTTLPQIGILDPGLPQHFEAFRRGMRDLGYVEGKSIFYIYRSAAGRAEPVPQLALELVALKPDVIVTTSPLPVRAVKEATSTIPIVFAALGDATVEGDRSRPCAIRRIDRPAAMPREISSRSSSRSATKALRRGAGAIPPLPAKTR